MVLLFIYTNAQSSQTLKSALQHSNHMLYCNTTYGKQIVEPKDGITEQQINCQPINQSINRTIKRSINHSVNQSNSQSINQLNQSMVSQNNSLIKKLIIDRQIINLLLSSSNAAGFLYDATTVVVDA